MSRFCHTYSLSDHLSRIGIFLLPYDALPVMPTHYRPISVYFFFFASVLYFFEYNAILNINKNIKFLLIFFIYCISIGTCISFFYENPVVNLIDGVGGIGMGLCSFFACYFFFFKLRKTALSDIAFFNGIVGMIVSAYTIAVVVSFFECLSIFSPFPSSFKTVKDIVFGGWQDGRLTGTSAESSWMAVHLALFLPLCFYKIKQGIAIRKNFCLLLMACVAFLGCFSATGFLIVVFSVFLYGIIMAVKKNKKKELLVAALGTCLLFILFGFFLEMFFRNSDLYFITRIYSLLDKDSFREALFLDGSVFVRIGFPLIAGRIFLDYPIFGTGTGSFAYAFKDYLLNLFPEALMFGEVFRYVNNGTEASVALYSKVFCEFGVLGAFVFLRFYFGSLKNLFTSNDKSIIFYGCLLVCLLTQQGSFAFVPMWVGLALANVFTLNKNVY